MQHKSFRICMLLTLGFCLAISAAGPQVSYFLAMGNITQEMMYKGYVAQLILMSFYASVMILPLYILFRPRRDEIIIAKYGGSIDMRRIGPDERHKVYSMIRNRNNIIDL